MTNAYQWIHLNIIFDVLKVYYNESLPGTDEQKVTSDLCIFKESIMGIWFYIVNFLMNNDRHIGT